MVMIKLNKYVPLERHIITMISSKSSKSVLLIGTVHKVYVFFFNILFFFFNITSPCFKTATSEE